MTFEEAKVLNSGDPLVVISWNKGHARRVRVDKVRIINLTDQLSSVRLDRYGWVHLTNVRLPTPLEKLLYA